MQQTRNLVGTRYKGKGKQRKAKHILPSNYAYEKAKNACRLDRKDIFLSENEVRVGLQAMLDFTLSRLILDTDNQILAKIADLEQKYGKVRIEYIYKLGMCYQSEYLLFI